jgi:hypothetical protein
MKKLYPILILPVFMTMGALAQNQDNREKTHYGAELNQFITGSGFSSGTEAYFTIIPDNKKQISIGLYFCSEQKKVTGITVHHERSLIRFHRGIIPLIVPYAYYDLIYRKTTMREVSAKKDFSGNMVTYTSMEHHLGVGARIRFDGGFFLNSEVGYGIYLGSIKKPSAPNPVTGEITGTNGLCALAKIGIGYTF